MECTYVFQTLKVSVRCGISFKTPVDNKSPSSSVCEMSHCFVSSKWCKALFTELIMGYKGQRCFGC